MQNFIENRKFKIKDFLTIFSKNQYGLRVYATHLSLNSTKLFKMLPT